MASTITASTLKVTIREDINLNGFSFDFGMICKFKFGKWNSVLGLTFDNGNEIYAEKTWCRYTAFEFECEPHFFS